MAPDPDYYHNRDDCYECQNRQLQRVGNEVRDTGHDQCESGDPSDNCDREMRSR